MGSGLQGCLGMTLLNTSSLRFTANCLLCLGPASKKTRRALAAPQLSRKSVIKQLDPIEKLYNLYLEEEDSPRIIELGDMDLDFGLKNRLVDLYLEL